MHSIHTIPTIYFLVPLFLRKIHVISHPIDQADYNHHILYYFLFDAIFNLISSFDFKIGNSNSK